MCKNCNDRTYFRIIEYDNVRYFACQCMENKDNIEKREGLVIVGINPKTGELGYEERRAKS